jgi:hypothetical protein
VQLAIPRSGSFPWQSRQTSGVNRPGLDALWAFAAARQVAAAATSRQAKRRKCLGDISRSLAWGYGKQRARKGSIGSMAKGWRRGKAGLPRPGGDHAQPEAESPIFSPIAFMATRIATKASAFPRASSIERCPWYGRHTGASTGSFPPGRGLWRAGELTRKDRNLSIVLS